ncbi:hypothetical protein HYPSUDRAFT_504833 [Hypholoma sublateritium FD-334 SS-4]|uniref:Uncharacterized protein n=1 Tax=Hypholoma sublateritium (strain FD-334 SS-4) TaxID=945553 RepID=A0A0D2PET1_HYPSF|nr:hypothetical protein HYPSUDRAFT_504833 [Hypholoma sublateritium FD-334 SS-4]
MRNKSLYLESDHSVTSLPTPMFRSGSHPASSPSPSMLSLKRTSHFISANLPINAHPDSDIDGCSRGKRRRRENLSPTPPEKFSVLSTCENRLQTSHESTFATTPAQFNLFSRPSKSPGRKGRRNPPSEPKVQHERQHGYLSDLVRLRSSAFWELRQSISENGEGLVRRMRDYEKSRSRHGAHHQAKEAEKRERKRFRSKKRKVLLDTSDASDDDILISSGESANHILRGTFLRTVKDPAEAMVVDSSRSSAHHTRSNYADTQYTTSFPTTDDEYSTPTFGRESGEFISQSPSGSMQSSKPSLSHSRGESPCSSFVSLPFSSPIMWDEDLSVPSSVSGPSTASEKAIAALNLALANGAGSINDYSPVNQYEEVFSVENYDHGDLWN